MGRASAQLKSCIANNTQNQKESLLNFLVKCLNFAMTPSFEADQPDAAAILSALPRSARRSLYREAKGDAKAAARLYVGSLHTSAQLLPYFNAIEGILAQKMSRVFTRAFDQHGGPISDCEDGSPDHRSGKSTAYTNPTSAPTQ